MGQEAEIFRSCPVVCGRCDVLAAPQLVPPSHLQRPIQSATKFVCSDNSDYMDVTGMSCSDHREKSLEGRHCFSPMLLLAGYSAGDIISLHEACPEACNLCEKTSVNQYNYPKYQAVLSSASSDKQQSFYPRKYSSRVFIFNDTTFNFSPSKVRHGHPSFTKSKKQ